MQYNILLSIAPYLLAIIYILHVDICKSHTHHFFATISIGGVDVVVFCRGVTEINDAQNFMHINCIGSLHMMLHLNGFSKSRALHTAYSSTFLSEQDTDRT